MKYNELDQEQLLLVLIKVSMNLQYQYTMLVRRII